MNSFLCHKCVVLFLNQVLILTNRNSFDKNKFRGIF